MFRVHFIANECAIQGTGPAKHLLLALRVVTLECLLIAACITPTHKYKPFGDIVKLLLLMMDPPGLEAGTKGISVPEFDSAKQPRGIEISRLPMHHDPVASGAGSRQKCQWPQGEAGMGAYRPLPVQDGLR
jgi:hypothetical protein